MASVRTLTALFCATPVAPSLHGFLSIEFLEGGVGIEPTHLISKTSICSNRFTPNKNALIQVRVVKQTAPRTFHSHLVSQSALLR